VVEPKKIPGRAWLWLLAGLFAVGAAFPFDSRVCIALDVTHDATLKHIAWWCSKIGEGWVIAVTAIFFSLVYLGANRPATAAKIFFVGLTSELIGLASIILRLLAGRARPSNHDVAQGFYGLWHDGHWIAGQFKFSSFPSGHAATAAGLVAAAWLLHRGWGAVLAVYAVAVMWSRIALQAHHLSDVLASVVLAIPMAIWLRRILLPSVEFQFGNLNRFFRRRK
jgi:membrane-associated phospholipid phosphatase